VPVTEKGKTNTVTTDEHPRHGTTQEALSKLPLVFPNVEGHAGIITAGSSSGITDGGAALVLASDRWAADRGLTPVARIIGWASAGVDPRIMGIGPVPAIERLQQRVGLEAAYFDLVEINEAFAAQVLAVLKEVPIAPEKLNVNGGAIALGHPIGCTGARMLVTLLHELQRRSATCGLATLCVSGGMGMAIAVELL
jgi:acetyl-CoA C-acetyltransferase